MSSRIKQLKSLRRKLGQSMRRARQIGIAANRSQSNVVSRTNSVSSGNINQAGARTGASSVQNITITQHAAASADWSADQVEKEQNHD